MENQRYTSKGCPMTFPRTITVLLALVGMILTSGARPVEALDVARLSAAAPIVVPAQVAVAPSQKDCQTIVACNFRRGGSYRGCISAYSCRACRFVKTRCRIVEGRRVCEHQSRCPWG